MRRGPFITVDPAISISSGHPQPRPVTKWDKHSKITNKVAHLHTTPTGAEDHPNLDNPHKIDDVAALPIESVRAVSMSSFL